MNNFIDNLAEKLTPLAGKLGSNRYLAVLRDAFMLSFPLTMFGSIVVVLNNLPFWSDDLKPEFPEFITREGQPLTPHIIPSASS